jgi:hypothetical protein
MRLCAKRCDASSALPAIVWLTAIPKDAVAELKGKQVPGAISLGVRRVAREVNHIWNSYLLAETFD